MKVRNTLTVTYVIGVHSTVWKRARGSELCVHHSITVAWTRLKAVVVRISRYNAVSQVTRSNVRVHGILQHKYGFEELVNNCKIQTHFKRIGCMSLIEASVNPVCSSMTVKDANQTIDAHWRMRVTLIFNQNEIQCMIPGNQKLVIQNTEQTKLLVLYVD